MLTKMRRHLSATYVANNIFQGLGYGSMTKYVPKNQLRKLTITTATMKLLHKYTRMRYLKQQLLQLQLQQRLQLKLPK